MSKSTADRLTEYGLALKKWKRAKDLRDENSKRERPAKMKPLESMPTPSQFELTENEWTEKTRKNVFKSKIPTRKL